MRSQHGLSLVELVVVVALIALFSGMAMLSGTHLIMSSRMSKAASAMADSVSLSRQNAIGRYEQWRIQFVPNPIPGSQIIHGYLLESCPLAVSDPGSACTGGWTTQREVHLDGGLGLLPVAGGAPVVTLVFDRTGQFLGSTTEIRICIVVKDAYGAELCQAGSIGRLIRVHAFTGFVET
jgi:prepilin-type N-terminal cleavage/methylation domain-containing protein